MTEQKVDLEFLAGQLVLLLDGQRAIEARLDEIATATKADLEELCRAAEAQLELDRVDLARRRAAIEKPPSS
jgi:hypothetical protein